MPLVILYDETAGNAMAISITEACRISVKNQAEKREWRCSLQHALRRNAMLLYNTVKAN